MQIFSNSNCIICVFFCHLHVLLFLYLMNMSKKMVYFAASRALTDLGVFTAFDLFTVEACKPCWC